MPLRPARTDSVDVLGHPVATSVRRRAWGAVTA